MKYSDFFLRVDQHQITVDIKSRMLMLLNANAYLCGG